MGYCFDSAYHSKCYAYESVNALIGYMGKEYNVSVFTAGTALDNIPSCKLLENWDLLAFLQKQVSFDGEFSFKGGNYLLDIVSR